MKKELKSLFIVALCVISGFTQVFAASKKSNSEEAEEEAKKNYMGWIDTSNRDVSTKIGNIKLKAITKLGTFNISVVNDDGKTIPVLYNGNEYTSSAFYLKANNKIYKLVSESNIKTAARRTNSGMQLNYSVKNVAEVFVDFKCVESTPGSGYDMVKITSTVTNKSPKRTDFALKLVLDTVLGEAGSAHFYTSADVPVKSETLYKTMKNEKWVMSKNSNAQMQILLDGADITSPEMVALANYSTLEKAGWEPDMLSYRTFDNVLSYNNSAVEIMWPAKKISVDSHTTTCFYLAFSTTAEKPEGEVYIASKAGEKEVEVPEVKIAEKADTEKTTQNNQNNSGAGKTAKSPVTAKTPASKTTETVKADSNTEKNHVTFSADSESQKPVETVSSAADKYSAEYIQALIDRITELENNPGQASQDEIELLNEELDAILKALM